MVYKAAGYKLSIAQAQAWIKRATGGESRDVDIPDVLKRILKDADIKWIAICGTSYEGKDTILVVRRQGEDKHSTMENCIPATEQPQDKKAKEVFLEMSKDEEVEWVTIPDTYGDLYPWWA
ncbi:hypothetical protein NLJ89_g3096 [Agrocybe chaxingu]|uniref:Uncharacterized protein n=1 Tax=Agrocybe chaxingu TaxID=84603 RepID=A0A9W8KBJ1_9AGAR|nr:hypothetical protein NLJ89_g3096 [Agrocybe chaxingu]